MQLHTSYGCWTRVLVSLAVTCALVAPVVANDWPQWRGPRRDGISTDKQLLREWPQDGPSVAWQTDAVGVGYSSLVVKDGRVFTQGDLHGVEHVIAIDEKDG